MDNAAALETSISPRRSGAVEVLFVWLQSMHCSALRQNQHPCGLVVTTMGGAASRR